jgi:high affinity Mn2+ porin
MICSTSIRKLSLFVCLLAATGVLAQTGPPQPGSADQNNAQPAPPQLTVFPHPDGARYLISGQANIIFQAHPGFHSPYEGVNSLLGRGEYKTSLVGTLYLGLRLHNNLRYNTDIIYNEESAGGRGVSEALGLAGFTNLDVVRNPSLGPIPYLARTEIHQTIGFTDKMVDSDRTQFSLATKVPERRLDLRIGRLSVPDALDINGPGSDSHLQFLNWTADNNGAWDYAANTRGYTNAAIVEYDDVNWSARYALALMPTVANGVDLEWDLGRARGENVELEYRKLPLGRWLSPERKGTVRLLGYANHANMGVYRTQNNLAIAARTAPVITAHAPAVTVKYGVGLNFEQELTPELRVFGRFGWNEGQHESYAYTEVDQTFELGGDLGGKRWAREFDKVGVVGISNAIKRDHQDYLKLGGLGFLIGDGRLNYGREDILEAYYSVHNWRGLYTTLDTQLIAHPGYNKDRGPVPMFTVRTHVDF